MAVFPDVRAVTFDVGGTLIDPWPSVGQVYAEVASKYGAGNLDAEKLTRHFALAWRAKTSFDYSRKAWAELVAQTFSHCFEPNQQPPFFEELYERFAHPHVWRVYDDVFPALEALSDRGIELGIISNWDERLRPLLERLKLDRYFRVMIISQEIGFCKPSPVIFEEAVRKFTCPAASILHVGDGALDDFDGARQAGFQSVLLDRRQVSSPDHVSTLAGLPALLDLP